MEGSAINSYVSNQGRSSSDHTAAPEESGWTVYFDDFFTNRENFNNNDEDDDALSYSSFGTPSLVSDAASCVPWNNKVSHVGEFGGGRPERSSKKKQDLLKKQRRIRGAVPEELEDTASSPVNSPKVGDHQQHMKHFDHLMNNNNNNNHHHPRKNIDENSIYTSSSTQRNKQQGSMSGHCSGVMQTEERIEHNHNHQQMVFMGRENDCTELKKKGLCVVPLSMLVNYYG